MISSPPKIFRSWAGTCVALTRLFLSVGIAFGAVQSAHANGDLTVCNKTSIITTVALAYFMDDGSQSTTTYLKSSGWYVFNPYECKKVLIGKRRFTYILQGKITDEYADEYLYLPARIDTNYFSNIEACIRTTHAFHINTYYHNDYKIVDTDNGKSGSFCSDLGLEYQSETFSGVDTGSDDYTVNLN